MPSNRSAIALVALTCGLSLPSDAQAENLDADALIQAALRYAGLDGPLDSWSTRARWSNLAPELEVTLDNANSETYDDDYREIVTDSEQDLFAFKSLQSTSGTARSDRITLRVRARIRPGGIIFDEAEIAAERLARQRSDAKEQLIRRIAILLSRRQAIQRNARTTAPTSNDLEDLEAIETEINALTNGEFKRQTGDI